MDDYPASDAIKPGPNQPVHVNVERHAELTQLFKARGSACLRSGFMRMDPWIIALAPSAV